MTQDAIGRAHAHVSDLRAGTDGPVELNGALDRARDELAGLAQTAAELQATVPEQVRAGIEEALRTEVLPVARNLAEVRGLSNQQITRLERVQQTIDDERRARIEDLDVLVDLLASSWEGLDARLATLEATLSRIESSLTPSQAPSSSVARTSAPQTN